MITVKLFCHCPQGDWLLLLNGQNCLSLLESLESLLNETAGIDSNFRMWISANDKISLPCSLLQNSVTAVIESPNMVRIVLSLNQNFLILKRGNDLACRRALFK